ncbi:MAG: mechanosensitive ion channel [Pirellulaceae bacterium]
MLRFAIFVFPVSVLLGLVVPISSVSAQDALPSAPSASDDAAPSGDSGALVFWNREIVTFRATYEQSIPQLRVADTLRRLEQLPEIADDWKLTSKPISTEDRKAVSIEANGRLVCFLLEDDVDAASGETLQQLADDTMRRLEAALRARTQQQRLPVVLRGVGLSALATLIFVALLWFISRLRRIVLRSIPNWTPSDWSLGGVTMRPQLVTAQRGIVRSGSIALALVLAYIWLTFVLEQFPYTAPWGWSLGAYFIAMIQRFALQAVEAVPGVVAVVIIILITRVVARIVAGLFQRIERGVVEVAWLQPETARATRRLAVALIWVFALTVAYPYIPGSDTEAFKGVSVLIGLVVSLGSTGLVNQIISGLVVVYARTFRVGEYVRVQDTEGVVTEIGLLSTKVVTRRREEITIPNAVLVGATATNYSRLSEDEGAVATAQVSIGYDTPWRQVHALLLLAAERTDGVRKTPAPRVQQKALSDFYVEYDLLVNLDRAEDRIPVLSALKAEILDAFNQFDVQIMSPHFETQPEGKVLSPPSQWYEAPARAEQATDTAEAGDAPPANAATSTRDSAAGNGSSTPGGRHDGHGPSSNA